MSDLKQTYKRLYVIVPNIDSRLHTYHPRIDYLEETCSPYTSPPFALNCYVVLTLQNFCFLGSKLCGVPLCATNFWWRLRHQDLPSVRC